MKPRAVGDVAYLKGVVVAVVQKCIVRILLLFLKLLNSFFGIFDGLGRLGGSRSSAGGWRGFFWARRHACARGSDFWASDGSSISR
jgi:hypothetical protein